MTIKVIENYDGLSGELVETIERKGTPVLHAEKRGARGIFRGEWRVSYKGRTYHTFRLPATYGGIAGTCISIGR